MLRKHLPLHLPLHTAISLLSFSLEFIQIPHAVKLILTSQFSLLSTPQLIDGSKTNSKSPKEVKLLSVKFTILTVT